MTKLGMLAAFAAICALSFATVTASAGDPTNTPCHHKELKTELVKNACDKGGQAAAKQAMKAFNKEHNIKSCNKCHEKLAPTYDLKADGLEQFTKLGGKLLADKK